MNASTRGILRADAGLLLVHCSGTQVSFCIGKLLI
jgi:hypothetical protein